MGNKVKITAESDAMHKYMKEINDIPSLTAPEQEWLFTKVAEGNNDAINKIVEANLKLVVHIAKRYSSSCSIPLMDLVQEGNIGLIEAVKRFDNTKGYKFSTYAVYWIKRNIVIAITNNSRTIRLPANIVDIVRKIHKLNKESLQKNNRELTLKELSKALKLPEERIADIMEVAVAPISLDYIVDDDNDTEIKDLIADKTISGSDVLLSKDNQRQAIIDVLNTLTEKEKIILSMRFGLDDGVNRTLEDVGQILGITRERVRQIEIKALKKLQQPARADMLRECI